MLRRYTEFQCHAMPGTGLKVCGGMVVVCRPILVFSLGQAEQKYNSDALLDVAAEICSEGNIIKFRLSLPMK